MSMHNIELSECEAVGLKTYKLPIGEPSQLSDSFRLGVLWANLWSAGEDGWISVDGANNLPVGTWHVSTISKGGEVRHNIAYVYEQFTIVGEAFWYDMPHVYAYKPLGELPEPPK